jgi:hypothetical protein
VKEDGLNRTYYHRGEVSMERGRLGDLVVGGMIILKRILNKEETSVLICFFFRSLFRSKNVDNQQSAL